MNGHPDWQKTLDCIDYMNTTYGWRCLQGVDDWGQAICYEVYGPGWSKDPRFLEANAQDRSEPPPLAVLKVCEDWLTGGFPSWFQRPSPATPSSREVNG